MIFNKKEISFLDNSSIQDLYFMGDIHGMFYSLVEKSQNLNNSIIILCGDVGMGFQSPSYYEKQLIALQALCSKNNNYILLVRGNHDDPHYFEAKSLLEMSDILYEDLQNIIFLKDFDLVRTRFGNILAIGGGISIDRESRTLHTSYWSSENIKSFPKSEFDRLSMHNIDIIVSHTAPASFMPYGINAPIIEQFAIYDKHLKYDLLEERRIFEETLDILMKNWCPKFWYYGHYHNSYFTTVNKFDKEIVAHGLTISELKLHNIEFENN